MITACKDNKGCVNCDVPKVPVSSSTKAPSLADIVAPKDQSIRLVTAEYALDDKTLKISNLGWCKTFPGHSGALKEEDKCARIYDYSKIEYDGKISYLYREVASRKPFVKIPSLTGVSSQKSSSSKKWEEALAERIESAVRHEVKRTLSLEDWKYQLEVLQKLQTSRCKSSKYHAVAVRNHPLKMGNRLLNTDNIFYLDTVFNTVTVAEIDLKKSKVIGFPLLLDGYKSVSANNWDDSSVLASRNNEITMYESDRIDDQNPIRRTDMQWFFTNCGIYYNSVLNENINTHQTPSLAFFPTFNSKYDREISQEVDRVLETMEKSTYKEATDYKPILTRQEVDGLVPAKENLSTKALEFLIKDGYEIYNLQQFKRGI